VSQNSSLWSLNPKWDTEEISIPKKSIDRGKALKNPASFTQTIKRK